MIKTTQETYFNAIRPGNLAIKPGNLITLRITSPLAPSGDIIYISKFLLSEYLDIEVSQDKKDIETVYYAENLYYTRHNPPLLYLGREDTRTPFEKESVKNDNGNEIRKFLFMGKIYYADFPVILHIGASNKKQKYNFEDIFERVI